MRNPDGFGVGKIARMAEYDIKLAMEFAHMASDKVAKGLGDPPSHRAVAYVSRVSMELALKSFIESAGVPVSRIRSHSHRLKDLLAEIDQCEIEFEISPGKKHWCSGSRLRSIVVPFHGYGVTAGAVLEAEDHGASTYPQELRYGSPPKDFPAEVLASAAGAIADWVCKHAGTVRWRRDA